MAIEKKPATSQKSQGTEPADNFESKAPVAEVDAEKEDLQRQLAELKEQAEVARKEKEEAESRAEAQAQRADEAEKVAQAERERADAAANSAGKKTEQKTESVTVVSATDYSYLIEGVRVTPDRPVKLERRFGNLLDVHMNRGLIKVYE